MARVVAISALLTSIVMAQSAEESTAIDAHTVRQWSAPYRGWHYYPDHVISAKPNIKGFEKCSNCRVTRNGI
jgi:hypothetical protein